MYKYIYEYFYAFTRKLVLQSLFIHLISSTSCPLFLPPPPSHTSFPPFLCVGYYYSGYKHRHFYPHHIMLYMKNSIYLSFTIGSLKAYTHKKLSVGYYFILF